MRNDIKIYLMYKDKEFGAGFPLTMDEKKLSAKIEMESMGIFGQMINNIKSIDQVVKKIEEGEKKLIALVEKKEYKRFASVMFLCRDEVDKIGEYKDSDGNNDVIKVLNGKRWCEYPALNINGLIFYRMDSMETSNGGLDLQKILQKNLLRLLKHHGLVCQGLDPILM